KRWALRTPKVNRGHNGAESFPQDGPVLRVPPVPKGVGIGAWQPVANFGGAQPKEALQQWVDALVDQIGPKLKGLDAQDMPQEAEPQEVAEDPRLAEAESKLNQSDFDCAMAVYDSILADEPDNAEIRQARNTTQLLKRLDPANRTTDPIAAAQQEP